MLLIPGCTATLNRYQHFDELSIVKPSSSRQANSERFLVAKGYRETSPPVIDHLFAVNDRLNAIKNAKEVDVVQVVPRAVLKADQPFYEHMVRANNTLGEKQLRALLKLHNFIKDPTLPGEDQDEIRTRSLVAWGLPDQRPVPRPLPLTRPCARSAASVLVLCVLI